MTGCAFWHLKIFRFAESEMLSVSLVLFAFATIIGWSYYGERAVEYLGKGGESVCTGSYISDPC